jgi:hypothetical protein
VAETAAPPQAPPATAAAAAEQATADAQAEEGGIAAPWSAETGTEATPPAEETTTQAADEPAADAQPAPAPTEPEPATPPVVVGEPPALGPAVVVEERQLEPRPWHIRATAGGAGLFARSESLDPLRTDDIVGLASCTLEAEWVLADRVPLVLQVGYGGAEFGATLFQDLQSDFTLHALEIGIQAGYRLWDAFMPFVRGGFVASWGQVRIDGAVGDLEAWAFAPGGYALAGIELGLPRRWMRSLFRSEVFTLAIRFEAGYLFLGDLEYDQQTDDSSLLDRDQVALGTVRLDGATIDGALILSF